MGTRAAWDHPLVSPTCAAQGSASAEEDRPCAGVGGCPSLSWVTCWAGWRRGPGAQGSLTQSGQRAPPLLDHGHCCHPRPQGVTQHLGFFLEDLFNPFLGRSRWGSVAQPWKRRGAIPATPSAPASQGCRRLDHISASHPSAAAPGRAGPAPSQGQRLGTHCTAKRMGKASWIRRPESSHPWRSPTSHCPIRGCRAQHSRGLAGERLSTSHVPWAGCSTDLRWLSGGGILCLVPCQHCPGHPLLGGNQTCSQTLPQVPWGRISP